MNAQVLHSCAGGSVVLPESPLISRRDGGNLVVLPPRPVWDRTALRRQELLNWSLLVAAAARAMLESLPQLRGGCINYWDAGNWGLNSAADPAGPKTARRFRKLHLHLIGRSRTAVDPAWQWGEAPIYPRYHAAKAIGNRYQTLTADECAAISACLEKFLADDYRAVSDA